MCRRHRLCGYLDGLSRVGSLVRNVGPLDGVLGGQEADCFLDRRDLTGDVLTPTL